jgi:superfamily II DNA or RNA helicase
MKTEVELLEKKWVKNIDKVIEIQEKGVDVFKKSSKVLFEYATGVGKSKQAIDCIEESITVNNQFWLILCWETAHIQNWKDEFKEWNCEHLLNNIHIICYASLPNYFASVDKSTYKINMICDEAHHSFSPTYWPFVKEMHSQLIMLTATLPVESRIELRTTIPDVVRVTFSLSTAIETGVLPKPAIFKVTVGFDNSKQDSVLILRKGSKVQLDKIPELTIVYPQHYSIIKNEKFYNLRVLCTKMQKLNFLNKNVEFLKQRFISSKEDWIKNQWVRAGGERKKFIAESKTEYARKLIHRLKNKRMIVFCGSVDQAVELGGDLAVHSKITAKKNKERIAAFQEGKTNKLYTNKMLTEGMNLKGIEVAILIQLDNKNLTFVQRAGRAMRAEFPLLFILIVPNSQDEKYFSTSTAGVNQEYIKDFYDYEFD